MTFIKAISSKAICHKDNPNALHNIKKELVRRQNGLCPITGRDLRAMQDFNVVVDHDHETGVIRAALPRALNGIEGKVKALLIRWGGCKSTTDMIQMLKGLGAYWEKHSSPQTEWLHPEYKTPAEERAARNAKARKVYANKKEK